MPILHTFSRITLELLSGFIIGLSHMIKRPENYQNHYRSRLQCNFRGVKFTSSDKSTYFYPTFSANRVGGDYYDSSRPFRSAYGFSTKKLGFCVPGSFKSILKEISGVQNSIRRTYISSRAKAEPMEACKEFCSIFFYHLHTTHCDFSVIFLYVRAICTTNAINVHSGPCI